MRETDNKEVNYQIYKFQMLSNTIMEQSSGLQETEGRRCWVSQGRPVPEWRGVDSALCHKKQRLVECLRAKSKIVTC